MRDHVILGSIYERLDKIGKILKLTKKLKKSKNKQYADQYNNPLNIIDNK